MQGLSLSIGLSLETKQDEDEETFRLLTESGDVITTEGGDALAQETSE
jgi:hypothetical protein